MYNIIMMRVFLSSVFISIWHIAKYFLDCEALHFFDYRMASPNLICYNEGKKNNLRTERDARAMLILASEG